ncbi:LPS export ABC transporter permease LptF [Rhizobiaceae bacterium BDR2-2]|uniref:LPS export ABC transporter permease LptF n=1 Tax=Ectorhizobium quercum TaxID=2965071 RepID=A0AAE3SWC3_9HYPH|nr:LPS export ABC transporter permease LptF [Ectorhizobium quercum]MCX8999022.1 LPS export ABC transporter permease LptF [Ectorhizobium quercum]
MKLIETYILKRITQMTLAALLPVLAILWTIQVLGRINLVTDSGQSIGSFMTLATLILPTIIPIVLPFAAVIGIAQTLTTMNNDSELAVIDAAAAPRSTLLKPVLVFVALLSLFSFSVSNFVEPQARASARQMIAAAYADLLSSMIEEKNFRSIQDGLYVQISERHSGKVLRGIFIVDQRDPNFDLVYYAREGAIDANGTSLTMQDGEVHRKTPDGKISIIRFDSYGFDLSDMTRSEGPQVKAPGQQTLSFLLSPDPDDKGYAANPGAYRAELHSRLTDWLFPFVYGLIAFAIAGDARSHREARLHPLISSLIAAFFLRWLSFSASNAAETQPLFIPAVYAVPLLSGLAAAIVIASGRKPRLPAFLRNRLPALWQAVQARLPFRRDPNGGAA